MAAEQKKTFPFPGKKKERERERRKSFILSCWLAGWQSTMDAWLDPRTARRTDTLGSKSKALKKVI